MPDGPFNIINDEAAPSAPSPQPATPPSEGAHYGPPGAGHVFEDGFSIPRDLSGGPGMGPGPMEADEDFDVGLDGPPKPPPLGGPALPGYDGGLTRTPADAANDPNAPVIPPATPETFVCMIGPCAHYLELQLGVDKPKDDPFDRPDLWRICRFMHDKEGEVSLKDANVPLCSGYSPPWWSVEGQRKKIEIRVRLAKINKMKPPKALRALGRCVKAAGHLKDAAKALHGVEE